MDTGVQTRKKKKKAKHGYATRGGADNEDMATNRLTTRALYDTDEEEVSTKILIVFPPSTIVVLCSFTLLAILQTI